MDTVKINSFEIENTKRIKAVALTLAKNGLTVVGGKNGQGKTSVLDSIAWALGGDRFKPSSAQREGSLVPPNLKITLSNGLIVERRGKNSDLKVTDPNGNKSGQQLLNNFIDEFALNLPKFMQSTSKEKAQVLLKIIGVGEELTRLEREEQRLYNERLAIGQIADQKRKYAKEMKSYSGVPEDLISASELIQQQQRILAVNGENQRKRENAERYSREYEQAKAEFEAAKKHLELAEQNVLAANKSAENLKDESTAKLEESINNIDIINVKVRANLDKMKAEEEAKGYQSQYDTYNTKIDEVRQDKLDLLKNADLPLQGLSVDNGELTYNGFKWDNMSGSEQLRVATAIVRKLNPKCGFVLLDKLEQMDTETLSEFGAWLEGENLQAIATRVSVGEECSIIIEDGYIKTEIPQQKTWKEGEF